MLGAGVPPVIPGGQTFEIGALLLPVAACFIVAVVAVFARWASERQAKIRRPEQGKDERLDQAA